MGMLAHPHLSEPERLGTRLRRKILIAAAASLVAVAFIPQAHAEGDDDDYVYYERPPPYQGGLIDSYDRYDPQLRQQIYPDRVPNNYDYEPRVPNRRPLPCWYTCGMDVYEPDDDYKY